RLADPARPGKPHPSAFAGMARALGCEIQRLVHVGDDLEADARAADAAGATGVWLGAHATSGVRQVARLTTLPELVRDMLAPPQPGRRLPRRHRNLIRQPARTTRGVRPVRRARAPHAGPGGRGRRSSPRARPTHPRARHQRCLGPPAPASARAPHRAAAHPA
ncbi:MAG: HAD hydrolase-like protein, partial [Verrucomicrobiota bacterium]